MWDCFGEESYFLDGQIKKGKSFAHEFTVVYDARNQLVYDVEHWDYENSKIYKWINPNYKKKYMAEAKRRDVAEDGDGEFVVTHVEPDVLLRRIKQVVRKFKKHK